ncbi:hypothetical protein B0T22DRAFT_531827 [Podospora appendiculata]|uniref:Uncharacterized protein n=1 Tax=Podospora appendiculata TaxID=314037 RepID=A0AAE0XFM2_9PEZI|nr:hypothetical protein B0T22DRAFT_531827 [Podospora appendiculata]
MAVNDVLRPSKRRRSKASKEAAKEPPQEPFQESPEPFDSPQRRESIWEAQEFIRGFVKDHWEDHWESVAIICELTLDELHKLGHLPRDEGIMACRRLLRVPVIHEEISIALWAKLAEITGGTGGDSKTEAEPEPEVPFVVAKERMQNEILAAKQQQEQQQQNKKQGKPASPEPQGHQERKSWKKFPSRCCSTRSIRKEKEKEEKEREVREEKEKESSFWKVEETTRPTGGSLDDSRKRPVSTRSNSSDTGMSAVTTTTMMTMSSTMTTEKKNASLPRRLLKKVTVPEIIGRMSQFGESLSYGYGNRIQTNSPTLVTTARF